MTLSPSFLSRDIELFASISLRPPLLPPESRRTNCCFPQSWGARPQEAGWLHLHCKHEAQRVGSGTMMLCLCFVTVRGNGWNPQVQELSQVKTYHFHLSVEAAGQAS